MSFFHVLLIRISLDSQRIGFVGHLTSTVYNHTKFEAQVSSAAETINAEATRADRTKEDFHQQLEVIGCHCERIDVFVRQIYTLAFGCKSTYPDTIP